MINDDGILSSSSHTSHPPTNQPFTPQILFTVTTFSHKTHFRPTVHFIDRSIRTPQIQFSQASSLTHSLIYSRKNERTKRYLDRSSNYDVSRYPCNERNGGHLLFSFHLFSSFLYFSREFRGIRGGSGASNSRTDREGRGGQNPPQTDGRTAGCLYVCMYVSMHVARHPSHQTVVQRYSVLPKSQTPLSCPPPKRRTCECIPPSPSHARALVSIEHPLTVPSAP